MSLRLALVRMQLLRPGAASAVEIMPLTSGAMMLEAVASAAGSVAAAGVPWQQFEAGLRSWGAQADTDLEVGSPAYAALRASKRAIEHCVVAMGCGDRLTYYGMAYVTAFGRRHGDAVPAKLGLTVEASGDLVSGETKPLLIIPAPLNLRIVSDDGSESVLAWDAVDPEQYGPIDGYFVRGSATPGWPYEHREQIELAELSDPDNPTWTVSNADGPNFVVTSYRVIEI